MQRGDEEFSGFGMTFSKVLGSLTGSIHSSSHVRRMGQSVWLGALPLATVISLLAPASAQAEPSALRAAFHSSALAHTISPAISPGASSSVTASAIPAALPVFPKSSEPDGLEILDEVAKVNPNLRLSELALKDIQGVDFSADSLADKRVVVYFWSIYCRSCVPTVKELQKLKAEFSRRNVELLTVHLFGPSDDKLNDAVANLGLTLPVLRGTKAAQDQFSIRTLPTSLVFGKDHRLIRRLDGMSSTRQLRQALFSRKHLHTENN